MDTGAQNVEFVYTFPAAVIITICWKVGRVNAKKGKEREARASGGCPTAG